MGGRVRRGLWCAAVVVGRRARGAVFVVEHRGGASFVVEHRGGASFVVGRRGPWRGAGLRVVVGSQSQSARGEGALVTGAFVVGWPVTDAVPAISGCGSGRVVTCRSVRSVIVSGCGGVLETGCVGCSVGRVVCDRGSICSRSGGVVA